MMSASLARSAKRWLAACAVLAAWPAQAQQRVSESVHNLSASGPGTIRAATEQQVCVFCHAPHHASGVRPLWNREFPTSSYTIYQSSTLDAEPGQPTGASKLCLSCHDGTIALGSVLSRADRIRMVGGDFLPAGRTNLGTDLSDDHPISFVYTSGLAASDAQLKNPTTLPPEVRLDARGELQCTACHDPHDNTHGNFLVRSNEYGALCVTCHVMDGWPVCAHRDANRPVPASAQVDWPYPTVATNACRSCHRPHTAGSRERLLIFEAEEENCLDCHGDPGAGGNILTEISKPSAHDSRRYQGIHDAAEEWGGTSDHVECSDCHNAHAVRRDHGPPAGYVPLGPTMERVSGISIGGAPVDDVQYEYEVCFRCHADRAVRVKVRVPRQVQTLNERLKFSPNNPSFHPVVRPVVSPDVPSLDPRLSPGQLIRCTDCHNSDTVGSGNRRLGPHGSIHEPLLAENYTTYDNTPESEYEYALCYRCHRRGSILNDESFPLHNLHIVQENAPCSICHDPHGITTTLARQGDHTHLINFDVMNVQPETTTRRLEFRDDGVFAGRCTLVCHGQTHLNTSYEGRFR